MTNDQIAAKYQFILDAIREGRAIEWRIGTKCPWNDFSPLGNFDPEWELRIKEPKPANPPYVVGWIGNNGTPITNVQVWVWDCREHADCCKGHQPFAVVTGEVVEALKQWIAKMETVCGPGVGDDNALYAALKKGSEA